MEITGKRENRDEGDNILVSVLDECKYETVSELYLDSPNIWHKCLWRSSSLSELIQIVCAVGSFWLLDTSILL